MAAGVQLPGIFGGRVWGSEDPYTYRATKEGRERLRGRDHAQVIGLGRIVL